MSDRSRLVLSLLSLLILVGGAAFVVYAWDYWTTAGVLGIDHHLVVLWAQRFLDTGQPYLPFQFAGPYSVYDHVGDGSPIMYPPTVLLLVLPFTVLPAVLWWAIPIAVTAWAIRQLRPRPMVWPVLALLVAFPQTLWFYATGNPLMWFVAAATLGAARGGWAALVILKPTLLPFALLGVWRRWWWATLAGVVLVSLPFIGLWLDYVTVLRNAAGGTTLAYNLNQWPTMMIPVIAWLGSQARERRVAVADQGVRADGVRAPSVRPVGVGGDPGHG